MKLLAAVLPRARRLVPSAERGMAVAIVAFLAALEVLGRNASTELHDLLAGTALLAVALFVLSWHRSQPLAWVDRLAQLLARVPARFDQLRYDVGIDFRGTPLLPRRLPRLVPLAFLALTAWAGLAVAAWWAYPDGWRTLGLRTSYVLYIVVMMALWAALFVCVLAGVYLPVSVLDQRMRTAAGEADPRGADAVVLVGYFVLAVLIAGITPPVYGLGLCLLVAAAALARAAAGPADDAAILWRAGPGRPVYSAPMRRVLAVGVALVAALVFDLLLSACGGRLTAPPSLDAAMPVTGFLGAVAAWLVPGLVLLGLYQVWKFRRTDPTRRRPAAVRVGGPAPPTDLARAARRIAGWGFRPVVADGSDAAAPVVGVRLVPTEQSEATEFDPRWPLAVSLADLEAGAVKDRLARRDEIQLRRQFFRGLAKLLKQSATAVPSPGGGFWIAPHWWFLENLLWEEPGQGKGDEPDPLRPVGPPYQRVFAPRVRQHVHQLLRAVQIDLIYVEHGVGHRKLEKVLRALTELYDVHGGKRRAEEQHFRGTPKVRVMIHEYAPGNPFRSAGYPEPKFDDVSRFRVLHVFRDRGGDEERVEPPFDFSWEPSPLSVG